MIFLERERSQKSGYIYHQKDSDLSFGVHIHTSCEYISVSKGKLAITIEGKEYILKEGQSCVILPNQAHSYSSLGGADSYLCVFSTDFALDFFEKYQLYEADCPVFDFEEGKITEEILTTSSNLFQLKSCFYNILAKFEKNCTFFKRNQQLYGIITEIINYIENNYTFDISLKSLSEKLGYSYNYTSNLFNDIFKCNFSSLVNEYRIAKAEALLKNTRKTITEIAILCGYNSLRAFNRNFKKEKGLSPREFLRK